MEIQGYIFWTWNQLFCTLKEVGLTVFYYYIIISWNRNSLNSQISSKFKPHVKAYKDFLRLSYLHFFFNGRIESLVKNLVSMKYKKKNKSYFDLGWHFSQFFSLFRSLVAISFEKHQIYKISLTVKYLSLHKLYRFVLCGRNTQRKKNTPSTRHHDKKKPIRCSFQSESRWNAPKFNIESYFWFVDIINYHSRPVPKHEFVLNNIVVLIYRVQNLRKVVLAGYII